MKLLIALHLWLSVGIVNAADESGWPLWDGKENVAEYAKRANLAPAKTIDLGNDVKLELVLVPAGKFVMGTPVPEKPIVGQTMAGICATILIVTVLVLLFQAWKRRKRPQFSLLFTLLMTFVASVGVWGGVRWRAALQHRDFPNEHPAHSVVLTNPFYLGKFAVTQQQYQQLIGANPSYFYGKGAKDHPVESVSWDDAQYFCKKLADQTKSTVRFPTEAEWEYSCRAGTRTNYYSGDTNDDLERVAWFNQNADEETHPVGQKEPNAFGLYDMHGNVIQWCQDWYGEDYYGKSDFQNPKGPAQGARRVARGGSWGHTSAICQSAHRSQLDPSFRNYLFGIRVLMPVEP